MKPIGNLAEANHRAMDAALSGWVTGTVKAWRDMTPAEREADALLSLAIRREMASRERRDGTYFPETGDVVTRLGEAERHERREDGVERVQDEAE